MLMIPPAFATKSGAHRIPRWARRSAIDSSESWLFAAPATTGACRRGTVSSLSTPPSAHGASTSTAATSALSGAAERGVGGRVARAAARLREPADVRGRLRDHGHVPRRRPDVLGGDVGAAQRLDGLAEVEQRVAPRAA